MQLAVNFLPNILQTHSKEIIHIAGDLNKIKCSNQSVFAINCAMNDEINAEDHQRVVDFVPTNASLQAQVFIL